ncbi:FecR domain-containing protein [Parabacteroides faecis]|uniref:FecR family protein n=1 Tax=Parabacteroides faecis TaxID=1217282 RepID=UPI0021641023|nr:FecR domain-containing protein [Parabacteroides faecis]MCS2891224.1 FecR domain-containing protein [Parabacteroides faecis]UVQ45123.1 FecR domain-containing protein [Parabacteroides faecis]
MNNEQENKLEQRIRFVAKHYEEGRLDTDKAWQQFAAKHQVCRTVSFRRYWMAVASVLLLLIGFGTYYITDRNSPEWVAITTIPGQIKDVYLPDSTLISMAGSSSIRYDAKSYGKERRVVEMKGKAFFKVTRNETRPFSVYTERTEVTVLGTSFQINEQPDGTDVNVMTGKVSFGATGNETDKVILTAGMSASYSMESKGITLLEEEDLNTLSWKTRQLRFNDTPLEKVIGDLNEYYQVKVINKAENPNLKLTATFNDLPLEDVLLVINQTLDTRLAPESNK